MLFSLHDISPLFYQCVIFSGWERYIAIKSSLEVFLASLSKAFLKVKKNKNQDNTSSSFFITPIFYVEWMSKKISCFILFFIFQTDHIRQRRNTIADKERLWPTGVVPYVFEEDLGNIKNKYLTYILFMTSWFVILFMTSWFVIFGTQYEFWFRYFFFQWLSNVINGIYFSQNPVRMDKKQIPKR